ncbi:olfactory receptor 5J3-like [Ambystoma mexicanum]|uniref:olfactory receptor 5J3-like n=1 Tax=Ambystoma mexicanum TaxID=8296 RepID=UPI0037E92AE2
MKEDNQTSVTEFFLFGLTDDARLKIPLFLLFLLMFIITLMGNLGIMTLIKISPRLQTPMYFLLSNLSFVDLCHSSNIMKTLLTNFLFERKSISLAECELQLFLFLCMGSADIFLLVAMAYDRYIAICKPLFYTVIMTKQSCIFLVLGTYLIAFLHSMTHTMCAFRLSFCGPNQITHFYCDILPLLKLSCSDTSINEAIMFFFSGSLLVASLVMILISYTYIISSILMIHSTHGRQKAFSTCSSHFSCVLLFFGTIIFIYLRPGSNSSLPQERVASVFYTVVIPMLNPIIYSLRNKEVKLALETNIGRAICK